MTFLYYTTDGDTHFKFIPDSEHDKILDFIEWLETDPDVVVWY